MNNKNFGSVYKMNGFICLHRVQAVFLVVDSFGLWLVVPPLSLVLCIQMLGCWFCFSQRDWSGLVDCVPCLPVSDSTLQKAGPFLFLTWPWYFLVHLPPAGLYCHHPSFPDPALNLRCQKYSSAWELGWGRVHFMESPP